MKFKLPQIFVFTILHSIVPDNPCESNHFQVPLHICLESQLSIFFAFL